MDDTIHGVRDKRGQWRRSNLIRYPPVFVWPIQPFGFLKWLLGYPGYIFPYNFFFGGLAFLYGLYLLPATEVMKTFSLKWISYLLGINGLAVFLFFGVFHLFLYIQRRQGTSFKYNATWPSTNNPAFLFRNQNIDNFIWSMASAVPIGTAFEVLVLWAYANDYLTLVSFADHPVYVSVVFLLIPMWRGVHFYIIHRLIHARALYEHVHKLHHNNVNPTSWSGLSMHPVEHLFYFSSIVIHFVIPTNPMLIAFEVVYSFLSPAAGHTGFDKLLVGKKSVNLDAYHHYLHHKHFECNYGNGIIPLDKWFGTFHDGSVEAEALMNERYKRRLEMRTGGSAPAIVPAAE